MLNPEQQLDCAKEKIGELEENKVALEKSLKESELMHELPGEKIPQNELEILHLKAETVCKN